MTRIITVDCLKWQRVIGIALWSGLTIGLGFLTQSAYGLFLDTTPINCETFPNHIDYFCSIKNTNVMYQLGIIREWQAICLFVAIVPSLANAIFIWRFINSKLHLIKIKCKERKYRMNKEAIKENKIVWELDD